MQEIIKESLKNGISYKDYRTMIDELLEQKKTTGANHSEDYLHYTKMNVARMNRLDKHPKLLEESISALQQIDKAQTWLVITEAWCGDAAQILPVINHLAKLNPLISLKHVLRDENPALMDLFLTGGGQSIPIIIIIDDASQKVLSHWGPRPKAMQEQVMARKNDPNATPYSEFVIVAQKWYAKDKTASIQREFIEELNG